MRITIILESFRVKKINELLVTSKKLTNNFTVMVIIVLWPDMAREPLVGSHISIVNVDKSKTKRILTLSC
jgi:hypothetical protein